MLFGFRVHIIRSKINSFFWKTWVPSAIYIWLFDLKKQCLPQLMWNIATEINWLKCRRSDEKSVLLNLFSFCLFKNTLTRFDHKNVFSLFRSCVTSHRLECYILQLECSIAVSKSDHKTSDTNYIIRMYKMDNCGYNLSIIVFNYGQRYRKVPKNSPS